MCVPVVVIYQRHHSSGDSAIQPHINAEIQPHNDAEIQPHNDAEIQPHVNSEIQPHVNAEIQAHVNAEIQASINKNLSGPEACGSKMPFHSYVLFFYYQIKVFFLFCCYAILLTLM